MDFNINNESFAGAYKCLKDANILLDEGLGNLNELDKNGLSLIDIKKDSNYDVLSNLDLKCKDLKNRMFTTMKSLSELDLDSALFFEEVLGDEFKYLDVDLSKFYEVTSYDAVSADGIKYSVDIIGEPNENTTIILLNHGGGGSYKELDSYLENEGIDKRNAIIIRYPRDGKVDKSYKLMEEVSEKYNISIQNCTTAGFSAGGKYAIKQMADLVAAHPEIEQPVVMLVDAYKASSKVTKEELKVLGDSGAILFSIQREGVDQEYINHSEWSSLGINFVKIADNQCKTSADPHNAVLAGYFKNGGFDYQVGNGNFRVETLTNKNGESYSSYEQPVFYNSETGEWDLFNSGNDNIYGDNTTVSLSTDDNKGDLFNIKFDNEDLFSEELADEIVVDEIVTDDIAADETDNLSDVFEDNKSNITNMNVNLKSKNNTLIAHKGYSAGNVVNNSKESFILAGEKGYWGCETDVTFDENGNLVCGNDLFKNSNSLTSFDEYLDICKEYGMTPVIDLKDNNNIDSNLSKNVLQMVKDKGMLDTSILQTNNANDVEYIRQNSSDARIWYLKDIISDSDMELIKNNGIECVNIKSNEEKNMYRLKNLSENGVDVCIWNVQNENYKNALIKNGVSYVMTDYAFDVSPYKEGDVDVNKLNEDVNSSKPVEPVEFVEPIESVESVEPIESVESVETVEPVESIEPVESVESIEPVDKVTINYSEVPLFYQSDYSNVNYGSGTLATHGCGIASLSMVASYYNDTDIMPDELAKKYRGYGSESGTDHGIYEKTADDLGLPFRERLHYSTGKDLQAVVDALNEGCVVVAKAKKSSVFTESGHYIVLTGVSEDGKIYVNDPNKYNYNNKYLKDGYENGFEQEEFKYGRVSDFFIYNPKTDSQQ